MFSIFLENIFLDIFVESRLAFSLIQQDCCYVHSQSPFLLNEIGFDHRMSFF